MTLSRREFLQIFGITVAGVTVTGIPFAQVLADPPTLPEIIRGRVLHPVTTTQGENIWADTLVNITGRTADIFHTDIGDLPTTAVQPIFADTASTIPESIPFNGRVSGAVGVIRAYCDPNAPLVTRIGHGGVMRITDTIHYPQTGAWYQVSDMDGDALGWTQAAHWSVVSAKRLSAIHITLDRAAHTLMLADGTTTAVNLPGGLPPGETTAHKVTVGGVRHHADDAHYHGVPYLFQLENGARLHGIYWHNTFGDTSSQIEVNTLVAGVLWGADDIHVTII